MILDLALVELLKLLGLGLGQLLALMVKNGDALQEQITFQYKSESCRGQGRVAHLLVKLGILVRLVQEHLRRRDGLLGLLFQLDGQKYCERTF